MRRKKRLPTAQERRERKEALGLAGKIVYILNYREGQPSLHDQESQWLAEQMEDSDQPDATDIDTGAVKALWDQEVEVDPTARLGLDEEEMLACQKPLRGFLDSWLDAGCDINKWSGRTELEDALNRRHIVFYHAKPTEIPSYYLENPRLRSAPNGHNLEMYTEAVGYMFKFITSPCFRDIGRCARSKCRMYYLTTRGHGRKRFCSQNCAKNDNATKVTRERRQQEHSDKLRKVKAAIAQWEELSVARRSRLLSKSGWKRWVAERARVTPNFVTRAVNKRELKPPAQAL